MKKQKRIPYYIVSLDLKVRTKAQAETLRKTLLLVYAKMVKEWTMKKTLNSKMWGKVK